MEKTEQEKEQSLSNEDLDREKKEQSLSTEGLDREKKEQSNENTLEVETSNSDEIEISSEDNTQTDSDDNHDFVKENNELKDKLLRSLAENENIRKQTEKVRIESLKYGVQPLARELLNVVDNFERALENKENIEKEQLLEGFLLINKEILSLLEKFKIIKIDAEGQQFDANFHQAMFEKPTDKFKVGHVCEIVQDGYLFHDRLLRPALVGVAKELKSEEKNEETENIDVGKENKT